MAPTHRPDNARHNGKAAGAVRSFAGIVDIDAVKKQAGIGTVSESSRLP
jgi:hypothetical protein